MPKRCILYARLSVTTEESVSIERQLDAGRKYAAARTWDVVGEYVDDGVSATKNRPEERLGWRAALDEPEHYDAAIVWKVDRLARRVLDFLHADEQLRARGAGIVAVEDPVDMTTAQGRAFATMLAVFGEMEAAAISARVTAARRAIVQAGRRAGGRPPYGWRNVPNPDGPGMVLAKDPETIGVVAALAGRALGGESLYSLAKWLTANVAPRPSRKRTRAGWDESTVEVILRNPALAGMTPFTPGRKPGDKARVEVLRGADGLPLVNEETAILEPAEWRRLLATLDERKAPGSRPYAGQSGVALLYGLARCGTCDGLLHRAMTGGKWPSYRCQRRECPRRVGVSRPTLEAYVAGELLATVGRFPVVELVEVGGADPAPALGDIEAAIADTLARMGDDDADVEALGARLVTLKAARGRARAEAEAAPVVEERRTGETFAAAWARLADDTAGQRALLLHAIEAVHVDPAAVASGRTLDPARVRIAWREGEA